MISLISHEDFSKRAKPLINDEENVNKKDTEVTSEKQNIEPKFAETGNSIDDDDASYYSDYDSS